MLSAVATQVETRWGPLPCPGFSRPTSASRGDLGPGSPRAGLTSADATAATREHRCPSRQQGACCPPCGGQGHLAEQMNKDVGGSRPLEEGSIGSPASPHLLVAAGGEQVSFTETTGSPHSAGPEEGAGVEEVLAPPSPLRCCWHRVSSDPLSPSV